MGNQLGLFTNQDNTTNKSPMAYRFRPNDLKEFVGQSSLQTRLKTLNFKELPHIIFWGPPGCGKTTLANILAQNSGLEIFQFNAVLGGINDLKKIIQKAMDLREIQNIKSIIFIDEIHRFNKSQQDALLPYLEKGDFVLFGATTEYPQTSLNKAIISRVQVWPLQKLATDSILEILEIASLKAGIKLDREIILYIAENANGDARSAINRLELLENIKEQIDHLNLDEIKQKIFNDYREYDKNADRHYDVISAFIKSVRGSDVDAAILWLAVMIDGGEDPEFIARRLIILASEDIGNADPRALQVATNAHYAIKNIGMPEARILLAQATSYLASAPKSNASYLAIDEALRVVRENPTLEVPTHLRNHHPDKKNYRYPHSFDKHWVDQNYLPKEIAKNSIYQSSHLGYERMQDENLDKMKS